MYRLDNERECSMGYSVPSKDRRPRGPKARVAFSLREGHYIPYDTSVHCLTDLEYDHIHEKLCRRMHILFSGVFYLLFTLCN